MCAEGVTPVTADDQVNSAIFEGLFVRALGDDRAMAADLLALGVDVGHLKTSYPAQTWLAALELARKRLYPEQPPAIAFRELGRVFLRGFEKTLIGSVLGVAAPLVGPARFLPRVPRMMNTVRPTGMHARLEVAGEREQVLYVLDPHASPEFFAGCFEQILTLCKATGTVAIEPSAEGGFALRIKW